MHYPDDLSEQAIAAGTSVLRSHIADNALAGTAEDAAIAVFKAMQEASRPQIASREDAERQLGIRSKYFADKISYWPGDPCLHVSGVDISPDEVASSGPCSIDIEITAREAGHYAPVVSILIMTRDGHDIVRLLSPAQQCQLNAGERKVVRVTMDRVLLSPRSYIFSIALFKSYDPDGNEPPVRCEILSRSFRLDVLGDPAPDLFHIPGKFDLLVHPLR